MNKLNELKIAAKLYGAKILCVAESHFDANISDAEASIEGYKLFRNDRISGKKCGGSCVYVHTSILSNNLESFNAPDTVGINLILNNNVIKLLSVYRSQNLSNLEQFQLLSQIENLKLSPSEDLIVLGDFNFPNVNWDNLTANCNTNTINNNLIIQKRYLDMFSEKGLTPVLNNGTVTRRRVVDNVLQESHLDQVLITNSDFITNAETVSALGKSDHVGVLVNLKFQNNTEYIQTEKKNWSKISAEQIQLLGSNINWDFSDNLTNTNHLWDELNSKLTSISNHVPVTKIKCTKNGEVLKKEPWDCSALKRKRKEKDLAWKLFEDTPLSQNLNAALHKQGEFEKKLSEKIIEYEAKIVAAMKTNPKMFYSYLNSKRKIKESISALKDSMGKLTGSPKDAATLLAKFFATTFTNEPYGPLLEECHKEATNIIGDITFSPANVKLLLLKLDQSKSVGPDGIHPKLLANLAKNDEFVSAITLLFKNIYNSGEMPSIWKKANVTALHKKGSKCDPSNYRPISLTCILCKVYEKIIRNHILEHVSENISRMQHGFMIGRSCLSNLLESFDIINDFLSEGETVDIFYLDFQKAFDSVPHYRLLMKLKSFGINNKTLDTISDFLSGRTFRVKVGNASSDDFPVGSGIPQGSVLGPLLFLLYINDLPNSILNSVSLFADDLKMYGKSSMKNTLQTDLDHLSKWQNIWLLKFNTKDNKCKVMHAGTNNPKHKYFLDGMELPEIKSEKDLGVLVSDSLSWQPHIDAIVKKANSCVAWVLRSVISRSPKVMLQIFKSMIRPHLEYCVQLWSPLPAHGNWATILAIENVQRTFTRAIDGLGLLTYENRLKKLGLTTLLERRARGDLIETFRNISGIANYGENFFNVSKRRLNIISRPGDQKKYKYEFLCRRVISYWNKLPIDVKAAQTINQFKNRLDNFRKNNLDTQGHFWELSNEIYSRLTSNRENYVQYMTDNPILCKIRNVNI